MKYRVLGSSGGEAPGFGLSSFLIDDCLLIDTGCVGATLDAGEQAKIDHILLTHSHLDHTGGLPLLADNVFGMRTGPIHVHGIAPTLDGIQRNLLNDVLWPDFSRLPSRAFPTLLYREVPERESFEAAGYAITAVPVNHAVQCVAYLIQGRRGAVLHVGDTGPTHAVWDLARTVRHLRAVCIETTFPNRLQEVADQSGHLTPQSLRGELEKLDRDVPVYVFHLKPRFRPEIVAELRALGRSKLRVLEDGAIHRF
jgi:glyoxylase-like metal-dependent hydrolase (beta-lactamase superfamily II)